MSAQRNGMSVLIVYLYFPDVCTNGDVQLRNGYSQNNGFAEVCIDGGWIGVCQPEFPNFDNLDLSSLLCKQLGYPRTFAGYATICLYNSSYALSGYTSLSEGLLESNRSQSEVYVSSFRGAIQNHLFCWTVLPTTNIMEFHMWTLAYHKQSFVVKVVTYIQGHS